MTDTHLQFHARASSQREPAVIDAVLPLRDQGFNDRQILNVICKAFQGYDFTDEMVITMPGGVFKRYVAAIVREEVRQVLLDVLPGLLTHMQVAPAAPADPHPKRQPGVNRLIAIVSSNDDSEEEEDLNVEF